MQMHAQASTHLTQVNSTATSKLISLRADTPTYSLPPCMDSLFHMCSLLLHMIHKHVVSTTTPLPAG